MKYQRLGKILVTMALLIGGVAGCAMAQMSAGERFGIEVAGRISTPKLESASLISDDKKVMVFGINAGKNYFTTDGVRIPEEVDFMWHVIGEKDAHLEKMALRSKLPADVIRELHRDRKNSLRIEFIVRNGKPLFRWALRRIELSGDSVLLKNGEETAK